MTAFDEYLETIIGRGAGEAHKDRSAAIEAHHLLLAIAEEPETTTRQALASAGLDHETIRAALDREFEHSLSAAGVPAADFDLPRPAGAPKPPTRLGASAKLALERMATVVRKRDLRPAHLLLGILQAQAGTVPRALALAGIDQAGLVDRVRQRLAEESGRR